MEKAYNQISTTANRQKDPKPPHEILFPQELPYVSSESKLINNNFLNYLCHSLLTQKPLTQKFFESSYAVTEATSNCILLVKRYLDLLEAMIARKPYVSSSAIFF